MILTIIVQENVHIVNLSNKKKDSTLLLNCEVYREHSVFFIQIIYK